MNRLVIADDHGLYRRGLRIVLEEAFHDTIAIHEVETLDGALSLLIDEEPIDLAILDLSMPGLRSLADLREIRRTFPRTRFVVLSAQESSDVVLGALASGLHGYIAKSQPNSEIVAAVTDVLSGRIYVPPWLSQASLATMSHVGARPAPGSVQAANLARLTPRQRDVLALVAEGLSNKEIAERLAIAETTTKIHVAALMRALAVRNRTEAAILLKTWIDEQNVVPASELHGKPRDIQDS